jgi:hypothetical protein
MKHSPIVKRSLLDELYADAPVRPRFRYPVHRDYFCASKPLAVFDTWSEAADYAMQNNLFMGDPMRRSA